MFVARTRELRPLHVIVQGKHMDVTPALRGYAETKIGKIARYFDQGQDAQVVLSVERRGGLGKAQGDAVLQMELLGHDFFVFRNGSTMEVNVVYRRNDGGYGVIEPEP